MLKVSSERRDDTKYFDRLVKYINNTKNIKISEKVGECFYVYCREKYNPKFDYNDLPMTDYKKEIIRDSIKSEYNYIIDDFFLKYKDIKKSLNMLYQDYKYYYNDKYYDNNCTKKQNFNINLKSLFDGFIKKPKNIETIECKLDDLYNILKSKNYLYDDEIKEYKDFKNNIKHDISRCFAKPPSERFVKRCDYEK